MIPRSVIPIARSQNARYHQTPFSLDNIPRGVYTFFEKRFSFPFIIDTRRTNMYNKYETSFTFVRTCEYF